MIISELPIPCDIARHIASMLPSVDLFAHMYDDEAAKSELASRFAKASGEAYMLFFSLFKPNSPHYFHYTDVVALKLAEKCIQCGADVNAANSSEYDVYTEFPRAKPLCPVNDSPLHLAAQFGLTDLAKLLLSHGADVNSLRDWGAYTVTPLHIAASKGHYEIAKLLIGHSADVNVPATIKNNQT